MPAPATLLPSLQQSPRTLLQAMRTLQAEAAGTPGAPAARHLNFHVLQYNVQVSVIGGKALLSHTASKTRNTSDPVSTGFACTEQAESGLERSLWHDGGHEQTRTNSHGTRYTVCHVDICWYYNEHQDMKEIRWARVRTRMAHVTAYFSPLCCIYPDTCVY